MRFGPGAYVSDPTEGITNVKDLPAPQLVAFDRTMSIRPALVVRIWPLRHKWVTAPCMIWAMCRRSPGGPAGSLLVALRSTVVSISTSI